MLPLQIGWDDARNLAKRRLVREQGRNDAADDLSELSEGEKEKSDSNPSESAKDLSRINSDTQIWSDDKSRHLYIVLIRYSTVHTKYHKTSSSFASSQNWLFTCSLFL